MKDGIYRVTFDSNQNDYGFGIVTVRNGSINGGDHTCYYQGVFVGDKVDLRVVTYNKNNTSVFGDLDKFNLDLRFREMPGGTVFDGCVSGRSDLKLAGSMHFLADAI